MAVLDTFDAYQEYWAIRLHFTTPSYDYIKYRGKTYKNWGTFCKDKSKRTYTSLAKKYKNDYKAFIAHAFAMHGEVKWVGDLLSDDKYHDSWMDHERFMQSSRIFKEQLNGIIQVMNDNEISLKDALINTTNNDVPIIEKLRIQELIGIETMIILDRVFKYSGEVSTDNPRWAITKKLMDAYTPLLKLDLDKYKLIIKESALFNRVVA